MAMTCNVGGADRAARIGLGTGLLMAGLLVPMKTWMRVVAEALGLIGVATGFGQYCPMSQLMGRNTCSVREQSDEFPVASPGVQ